MRQHLELCLRVDDEQVRSLWVRIKGQTSEADTLGVCSGLPDQEDELG